MIDSVINNLSISTWNVQGLGANAMMIILILNMIKIYSWKHGRALNQPSTFQIITFFKNVEKRRKDLKDSADVSLLLTSLSCIKESQK